MMRLLNWIVAYIFSLFISIFAFKGYLLALLISVPIIWNAVKHIVIHKSESSMIPATMTLWVLLLAILSRFSPIEIPTILELIFTFGTSIVLGYGAFYTKRRYFETSSIVELEVKKQPFNLTEKLEEMDKVIAYKKAMVKKYGWKGLIIEEIDLDHEENSIMFVLGREVELDKKRYTERS